MMHNGSQFHVPPATLSPLTEQEAAVGLEKEKNLPFLPRAAA